MAQYIQLINNTCKHPLDVYTLASNNLKPLLADQGVWVTSGILKTHVRTSVEVYYKYLQNQLDYVDKCRPLYQRQSGSTITGVWGVPMELSLCQKSKGKLQGWITIPQ